MPRRLVVKGEAIAVVPMAVEAGREADPLWPACYAHAGLGGLPCSCRGERGHAARRNTRRRSFPIGGPHRIAGGGVLEVGQNLFLMLLLVVQAQLNRRGASRWQVL